MNFQISKDVLIPRPETELLVETAIAAGYSKGELNIADVGTGSGCIAVSLAKAFPEGKIVATDISFHALMIAKKNIHTHAVENQLQLIQCHLLDGIDKKFQIICANLPYIPSDKLESLDVIKHEPASALDGGVDGLMIIKELLINIQEKLHQNGVLILEIEESHGKTLQMIIKRIFPKASCTILKDLAGLDRVVVINSLEK